MCKGLSNDGVGVSRDTVFKEYDRELGKPAISLKNIYIYPTAEVHSFSSLGVYPVEERYTFINPKTDREKKIEKVQPEMDQFHVLSKQKTWKKKNEREQNNHVEFPGDSGLRSSNEIQNKIEFVFLRNTAAYSFLPPRHASRLEMPGSTFRPKQIYPWRLLGGVPPVTKHPTP